MIVLMKFLDTADADVDRIRSGRKNIQRGITVMVLLMSINLFFIIVGSAFISYIYIIHYSVLFVGLIVVLIGLMVKREIYSMMIYFKELEVGDKWK